MLSLLCCCCPCHQGQHCTPSARLSLQYACIQWPTPVARLLTTLPMCFRTRSGYSLTASLMLQKMTPALASSSLKVVAMDTLSNTASTATFARRFCSFSGMPCGHKECSKWQKTAQASWRRDQHRNQQLCTCKRSPGCTAHLLGCSDCCTTSACCCGCFV